MATTTTERAQAFGTEAVFEERAYLAATLADQGDDVDVGVEALGDLAQQGALADAAAGEDADALSLTAGQQSVDGATPGDERLANPRSVPAAAAFLRRTG